MKTNPDFENDDALLDSVLRDENWQTASAMFKSEAVRKFRSHQRVRKLTRWGGSALVLAGLAALVAHWFNTPVVKQQPTLAVRKAAGAKSHEPRYLTDEELLASFPKGSCFLAEVDGKKELVFVDSKLENLYMGKSSVSGN